MDRVPDSIFDVLQGVADDVGTTFSGASELEKTIWFATSLEPSPPSQHDLRKICAATRDSRELQVVCKTLAARMQDTHWRFIYKSLIVAGYCLERAPERFEHAMGKYTSLIRRLTKYKYVDEEGNDRGLEVRRQAKLYIQQLEGAGAGAGRGGGGGDFDAPRSGRFHDAFDDDFSQDKRGGSAGAQRPNYEEDGTGLFSDEDDDAEASPKAETPRRPDRDGQRTRSPPRRQVSGPRSISKRSSAEQQQLFSKLSAFSIKDTAPPARKGPAPPSPTTKTQPVRSLSLLDDMGDDEFGDFATRPAISEFGDYATGPAISEFGDFATGPTISSGLDGLILTATPLSTPASVAAQQQPMRPMAPMMAPRPIITPATHPMPRSTPPPMLPTPQRPAAPQQQQPAKKPGGLSIDSLVNLDATALSRAGGHRQPAPPKKSAPLAQMKWGN